jgi:hypothetical protein
MRLLVIYGTQYYLLISARHATRYAVCRRQFRNVDSKNEERKLLDYQTHMAILGPHLCTGIVISGTAQLLTRLNAKALRHIEIESNYSMLDLLHHFTSGIKAFSTEQQYVGQDEMR